MKSPTKTHGGKRYLAPWIVSLFPHRRSPRTPRGWTTYVEPYCGGASVLFANEPQGISEVICDKDGEVVNFWRVLQDPGLFKRFLRRCQATPFAEEEFRRAYEGKNLWDETARAWAFFVRARLSLAARGQSFAPPSLDRIRRGMNEQASAWLAAVDGLPEVHERLRRVYVPSPRDGLETMTRFDDPRCLVYIDCPYLPLTRTSANTYGEFEMTQEDHKNLLSFLTDHRRQARFLVSGYPSDLYESYLKGWHRHTR